MLATLCLLKLPERCSSTPRLAEQVERGIATGREIGRSVVDADLAGVFAQRHIAHVMLAVLDLPVSAPHLCDPCGIRPLGRQTRQGGGPLLAGLAPPRPTDVLDLTIDSADLGKGW